MKDVKQHDIERNDNEKNIENSSNEPDEIEIDKEYVFATSFYSKFSFLNWVINNDVQGIMEVGYNLVLCKMKNGFCFLYFDNPIQEIYERYLKIKPKDNRDLGDTIVRVLEIRYPEEIMNRENFVKVGKQICRDMLRIVKNAETIIERIERAEDKLPETITIDGTVINISRVLSTILFFIYLFRGKCPEKEARNLDETPR